MCYQKKKRKETAGGITGCNRKLPFIFFTYYSFSRNFPDISTLLRGNHMTTNNEHIHFRYIYPNYFYCKT